MLSGLLGAPPATVTGLLLKKCSAGCTRLGTMAQYWAGSCLNSSQACKGQQLARLCVCYAPPLQVVVAGGKAPAHSRCTAVPRPAAQAPAAWKRAVGGELRRGSLLQAHPDLVKRHPLGLKVLHKPLQAAVVLRCSEVEQVAPPRVGPLELLLRHAVEQQVAAVLRRQHGEGCPALVGKLWSGAGSGEIKM